MLARKLRLNTKIFFVLKANGALNYQNKFKYASLDWNPTANRHGKFNKNLPPTLYINSAHTFLSFDITGYFSSLIALSICFFVCLI